MTTFIAYGNINDTYPLDSIPRELLIEKLRQPQSSNQRVQKRHRCRWVAHFVMAITENFTKTDRTFKAH